MLEEAPAKGTESAETVESLQAKLEEATAEIDKWKKNSRKNEDFAKSVKDAIKERDDLKARIDAIESEKLTEAEKAEKRLAELEARLSAAEKARIDADLKALRARIGAEKKLPAALIDRLVGDDEESISADADALLEALPAPEATPQWPDLGQGGGGSAPTDPLLKEVMSKVGR
jgi:DNA repair ATPase RecN